MDKGSRAVIDLQQLHGTEELKLGQTFNSGSIATKFMQDYCFNANKKCIVVRGSGKSNTYGCSDENCSWEVRVCRRGAADGTSYMYVSTLRNEHHDFCTSIAKPTERQIQILPTFRAAVTGDRGIKRKAVIAMVQARDHVNLQGCKSKLYRAKNAVVDSLDGEWVESFSHIASLLAELRDRNPGTTVHLDVDQHQRFLRAFVAFGASVSTQESLQPLLGFDGAHSKHSKYNGVILSLLGRDGNGRNVTLAMALANVENECNILWFLELCMKAGIKLSSRPIFCDRGKIIGAVEQLYHRKGEVLDLRFCTVHILRNIKRQFGSTGRTMDNAVWKVQSAETQLEYVKAIGDLRAKFKNDMADYVIAINPARWTVHGNVSSCTPIPWVGDNVPTTPHPLFGWRSNNFVESDNGAMIHNGIREAAPYDAFIKFATVEMKRASERDVLVQKWRHEGRVLTPHAKILWEAECSRVGEYLVERSSSTVYFVAHSSSSRYRRVDVSSPSCSCTTFDQMKIACRHIVAALQFAGMQKDCVKAFHPSYTVEVYANAFEGRAVELPLRTTTVIDEVNPSPYYKQVGRRVTRRIASAGEAGSKSTYICTICKMRGHNKRTCRRHVNEADEANDEMIAIPVELPACPKHQTCGSLSDSDVVAAEL